MKKKLIIILLLCSLCLTICACNISAPNEANQNSSTPNDALPPTENTTPNDTEPTDTDQGNLIPGEIVKPNIEYPLLGLSSKEEYTEFLNSVELPDDFVSYDKIDAIGDFDVLIFLSPAYTNNYSSYMYRFVDSEGFAIILYVDHRDQVLSTESSVSNVNKTNMRLLPDTSKNVCVYVSNNMKYTYISGKLQSISWKTQNITYTLCASGTPGTKMMLSDYPLTTSTFVGKMLNTETAPQALNTVFNDTSK